MNSPAKNIATRNTAQESIASNLRADAARREVVTKNVQQFQKTGIASFNQSAGISGGILSQGRKTLGERLAVPRPAVRGKKGTSEKENSTTDLLDAGIDDDIFVSPTQAPTKFDLANKRHGEQRDEEETARAYCEEIEKEFEEKGLGTLQRYVLLQRELVDIDKALMSDEKRDMLKISLRKMMTAVYERDPRELRSSLQASDEPSVGAGARGLPIERSVSSVRDLRFLYGANDSIATDTPLSPLTMLKALSKHFGAEYVVPAINELRSRMMTGLRRP